MKIIEIINNLKIKYKILILATTLLFPFLLITPFLFFQASKTGPSFIQNELKGLVHVKNLLILVKNLQEHRGMTAGLLPGDLTFSEKIQKKNQVIQATLESIENNPDIITEINYWRELKEHTIKIIKTNYPDQITSFKEHTELIDELIFEIRKTGDKTNLTSDPNSNDLLAELIIKEIPSVIEVLGQTRAMIVRIVATGKISSNETVAVSINIALINSYLKNIIYLIDQYGKEDPEFKEKNKQEIAKAMQIMNDLVNFVSSEILHAQKIRITPAEAFDKATSTINAAYDFNSFIHNFIKTRLEIRHKRLLNEYYAGIVSSILFILFSLYLSVVITGKITTPLRYAVGITKKIAQGDLLGESYQTDKSETGIVIESIDIMKLDLHNIIGQLVLTIRKIEMISQKMKNSAIEYSNNSQDQAASAEETASTIGELTTSVASISNFANEQSVNARGINARVISLSDSIKDVTSSMKELEALTVNSAKDAKAGEESIKEATDAILEVTQISTQINQIVNIITEIAQQTDLLALNASIEAARAGDSGRGFAVVAEEISKLSAKTSLSAREISELIKRSGKATNSSSSKVTAVVDILKKLIYSIDQIGIFAVNVMNHMQEQNQNTLDAAQGVSELTAIFNEMNTATMEQHRSLEEASMSTQNIAIQTQNISIGAEDINNQAENLGHILDILHQTINKFKIDEKALVMWNSSFSVGNAEMDAQHKQLFHILQDMYNYLQVKDSIESIHKCMAELKNYAVHHLSEEEELMKKVEYPDFANHKAMHDRMTKKIIEFEKSLESHGHFVAYDIIQFVSNWLIHHIREEDTKYGNFIKHGSMV